MSDDVKQRLEKLEATVRKLAFLQGEIAIVLSQMRRDIVASRIGSQLPAPMPRIVSETEITETLMDAVRLANAVGKANE